MTTRVALRCTVFASALLAVCSSACQRPEVTCEAAVVTYRVQDTEWVVPVELEPRAASRRHASDKQGHQCGTDAEPAEVDSLVFGPFGGEAEPAPRDVIIDIRSHPRPAIIRERALTQPLDADSTVTPDGYEARGDLTSRFFVSRSPNSVFDLVSCGSEDFVDVGGRSLGRRCTAYATPSPRVVVAVVFYTREWPLESLPDLAQEAAEFLSSIRSER